MTEKSKEFFEKMQEYFPMAKEEYIESIQEYGEVLETVVIEDIFMPYLLELLSRDEKQELLKEIFQYFEEIMEGEDSHLINIISITILEILGIDDKVLETAKKYMGTKTMIAQKQADNALKGVWK